MITKENKEMIVTLSHKSCDISHTSTGTRSIPACMTTSIWFLSKQDERIENCVVFAYPKVTFKLACTQRTSVAWGTTETCWAYWLLCYTYVAKTINFIMHEAVPQAYCSSYSSFPHNIILYCSSLIFLISPIIVCHHHCAIQSLCAVPAPNHSPLYSGSVTSLDFVNSEIPLS